MKKDMLEQADVIPPYLCRLCARQREVPYGGRAKSMKRIAKESGLSLYKVMWLSRQPTWTDIRLCDAMAFARACDVDLLRPRVKLHYLKRIIAQGPERTVKILGAGLPAWYVRKQLMIGVKYAESMEQERRTADGGGRRKQSGRASGRV